MTESTISSQEASVQIGGTTLLRPTTFAALAGELWCLTGPNGSGKTTLLRALGGRLTLTAGSCHLAGRPVDPNQPSQRRLLAALVEPIPVARDLTVAEQISMVAVSWFGGGSESRERTSAMVEELGLNDLRDRFPHELSAGQLQLFGLALVLVRPADVVLLDEPERHLDSARTDRLAELLVRRTQTGTTVIAATHEPRLVEAAHHRLALV